MSITNETGWLLDLYPTPLGSALIADAAVGATVLAVNDAVDFDTGGGTLHLNGVELAYDTADPEADTVTLSAPLAAAASAEDKVIVWDVDNDLAATELRALVEFVNATGDDDPIPARLAHGLGAQLPMGPRGGRGETVTMEQNDGSWRVVDVVSKEVLLELTYGDLEGQHLSIGRSGIRGYRVADDSGTPDVVELETTFAYDVATGNVTILGAITSGSTITGTTITGGILQTTATASRGIKIDATNGLRAFNSSGDRTVKIDPDTGRMTLDDELIANNGATFKGPVGIYSGSTINILLQTGGNASFTGSVTVGEDVTADELYSTSQVGSGTAPAVFGASGQVRRDTSSQRYKDRIAPLEVDVATVLALDPVTYRRKDEVADVGEDAVTYAGFVAEQAHDLGLAPWVLYDVDGRPDGFNYPAFTAALLAVARAHAESIADLRTMIEETG